MTKLNGALRHGAQRAAIKARITAPWRDRVRLGDYCPIRPDSVILCDADYAVTWLSGPMQRAPLGPNDLRHWR